ncbi:MAG: pilus assembly protein PilM [Solirubrobacteraceae bacterium]
MKISSLLPDRPLRPGTRRSSATVALDIGPDAIVVLQSSGTERARVRRAIVHPLPVGLVVDGEVVNADQLAVELRALFTEHKLPRDVRVGLAHPRLMVRMVELPASLSGRDLDGAVQHMAGDLLPVALDQLVVDYRCVGKPAKDGAGAQQRVLMAAARVDGIERLTQALAGAHLKAERIQLSGLAMLGAFDHPPLGGEAVLYVQAGALTNVVIAEDGEPLLVRAASAGSESIAQSLAERTGITHEQARRHIAATGVNASRESASDLSPEVAAAIPEQVREGLRRVVAEIESSRGFYCARPDARPIGGVVLTGAMTTWPGVADVLREELNVPVLPAGRDAWPDLGTVSVPPERLDVAVGLALASGSERPDLRPAQVSAGQKAKAAPNALVAQVACGATALVAAATIYGVVVSNQVSSGQERLAEIRAELVQSERQAAALQPFADFDRTTKSRRTAVTTIATARFNWDRSLTELSKVVPGDVWLTSAKGTLTPTSSVEGGSGGDTGSLRGALPGPAFELAGCAKNERDVPKYIDRLYSLSEVEEVGFSRTERPEPSKQGSPTTGNSDCAGDDDTSKFSVLTYFKQSPALAALAAPAATPAAPGAPAATPTNTQSGGTAPATQTATNGTGGPK